MPNNPTDDPPAFGHLVHDAYAAIRRPNFRRYWIGNVVSVLGLQMQSVTVIWEIYRRTGNPFDVGLVGLVQVIPFLSLALLAGHVADRMDRKLVIIGALALSVLASLGLASVSYFELPIPAMFGCLFFIGVARAFLQPSKSSFLPQLVPREIFSNAVTWGLGGFQLASVAGPCWAVGSWRFRAMRTSFICFRPRPRRHSSYYCSASSGITPTCRTKPPRSKAWARESGSCGRTKSSWAPWRSTCSPFCWACATALLPVFAKEVLHVGPVGYGWMASAPAIGALTMSLALMHRPPMAKAGQTLLWAVAGFGGAIIVFGLSRVFVLSFAALLMTGALDCISVVIRHTLVQILTPDRMRGRVSAISGMFIGASNELGEFESGTLARLTSPIFAVVSGGVGTIVVVVLAALAIPELRNYGPLVARDRPVDEPTSPIEPEAVAKVT